MTLSEEEEQRRLDALRNADTVAEAARELGLTYHAVLAYSQRYYDDHLERFGRVGRSLDEEEKQRRLDALRNADSVAEAARELGLKYMTVLMFGLKYYPEHRERFSYDVDVEARLEALESSDTITEAAEKLDGVTRQALHSWSEKHYDLHEEKFAYDTPPEEARRHAMRVHDTIAEAARALDWSYGAMYYWVQEHYEE